MVTTRASSRESTPAGGPTYTGRVRTSARRSTTAPTDGGTPTGRSRARKTGPTAAARTGNTSHAYGVSGQALSSRVAGRTTQGFSSALNNELVDQEAELSSVLPPVAEEDRHSSRASSPASNRSSSLSMSPTDHYKNAALDGKSFSYPREDGLSHPIHFPVPTAVHTAAHEIYEPPFFDRFEAAVSDLVHDVKRFFSHYWRILLCGLLALTFGSILAIYGVPAVSRAITSNPGPTSIAEPGNATHVTTIVTSYLSKPSDRAIASRLNHLESRVNFLEDELARTRASNVLLQTPFNHISASIGATILPTTTSLTKRTVARFLIFFSKFWTPPGMKGPITALQPWSEPGECWCTPADKAALGVRAPYPLKASAVTIEHILADDLVDSGAELDTAPSLVEVWARVAAGEEQKGECLGAAPEDWDAWTCLGRLEVARHVGDVRSWTMDLAVDDVVAKDFVFTVLENLGNTEATCLYRVQLHGTKM